MIIKLNDRVDTFLWKLVSHFGYDMDYSNYRNPWIISEIFLYALKSFWPAVPANSKERFHSIYPLQGRDSEQDISFETVNENYRITGSILYEMGKITIDGITLTSKTKNSDGIYPKIPGSQYLSSFNKDLQIAVDAFEENYDRKLLVRDFFGTFHHNGYTNIDGGEAVQFYHIYNKAIKAYPIFMRKGEKTQVQLLKAAWKRISGKTSRDIYACAKATYEVFKDNDMLGSVIFFEEALGKFKHGEAVHYQYKNRYDYETGELYERHALIFVTYKYYLGAAMVPCCRSLLCSDLWFLLARDYDFKLDVQIDGEEDAYESTSSLSID